MGKYVLFKGTEETFLALPFLDTVPTADSKAATIDAAVREVMNVKKILVKRIFDLGTDGASVMTDMTF